MSTSTFERALVQADVCLSDQRRAVVLAETTPVAGLAIIARTWVDDDTSGGGEFDGQWAVLHLASGKTVTAALPGLAQAREQARLLGELRVNWTAPAKVITAVDPVTHTHICETWLAAYEFGCDRQEDDDDND